MSSSTTTETAERRLHPVGMLLEALATVRRWFGLAAFPGVAALLNGDFGMRTLLLVLLGVALIAVFSAFWGVLSWRGATYRGSGGGVYFKQGWPPRSSSVPHRPWRGCCPGTLPRGSRKLTYPGRSPRSSCSCSPLPFSHG